MSDIRRHLQDVADEGARLAYQPPSSELRHRLRVRRRRAGTLAAALVLLAVAGSASAWYESRVPSPASDVGTVDTVPDAVMSLAPDTVHAGQSVAVTGTSCDPDTLVFFSVGTGQHSVDLGQTVSDSAGGFSAQVRIGADVPIGPSFLWAACKAPNALGKLAQKAAVTVVR